MKNIEQVRESKKFWASIDGAVSQVTGWSCAPANDYWWCPELGYSMREGSGLFKTELAAINDAIREMDAEFKSVSKALKSLHERRSKL